MSDHEFERQVQEKMDELKFRPSADVWKGVELELDRDRKRRRAIFWLPAALLVLLGVGGYLFYDTNNSNPSLTERSLNAEKSPSKISTQPSSAIAPGSNDLTANPKKQTDVNQSREELNKSADRANLSSATDLTVTNKQHPSALAVTAAGKYSQGRHDKIDQQLSTPLTAGADNFNASSSVTDKIERNALPTVFPALMGGLNPSVSRSMATGNQSAELLSLTSSATTKQPSSKKSSWSYGVSAKMGMSGMNEGGMFNFNRASVVDLSGGIANSAFLPANTVIYKASEITPERGFSVGGYANRSLNKKLDLSFGLGFTRFNSSVMVGRKMNGQIAVNATFGRVTLANPYYTREPETKYLMHLDFVEVPVNLSYKVNPSARLPLSVNAGIIAGRLVGSNALHFDGSSAGYFKNNDLLKKWQLGVNAGLALSIMNRSKHPVTVGPSFRYQLTNSLSNEVKARRNIIGVDLGLGIRLGSFKSK